MRDDDLAALLRDPALGLEPPGDLLEGVRRGARRTRRRQTAATVALSVVALATAVTVGPGLLDGGRDGGTRDVAAPPTDPRFPDATSAVLTLADVNGGQVLTFFRGGQWCTASVRSGPPNLTCAGVVGQAPVRPFAFVRGQGTESLSVDRDYVVAGVLGDDVARVSVEVAGAGPVDTRVVSATGFGRPVWFVELTAAERVAAVVAYAEDGSVVERRVS